MLACATGKHINSATLTCRTAGFEFQKVRLFDVLVSSCAPVGATHEDRPEYRFSLNFVKIDFLYTVQRTGEVVETSMDFS